MGPCLLGVAPRTSRHPSPGMFVSCDGDADSARQPWRAMWPISFVPAAQARRAVDESEADVLAYRGFPAQHRSKLHATDEMDKRFVWRRAILPVRGRPRGEERGLGCKPRQAA